jgi:hypothetical protein
MEEFGSAFHAARCVSTPLVAVRTADPASTTYFLIDTLKQSRQPPPLLGWDVIRGLYAIGKDSGEELVRVLGDREAATVGPADALSLAHQLGENGLLLYSDAYRFWDEPGMMQGIWNLRDSLKATGRMLVLLPTAEERETIWEIYLKKYNVSGELPNDKGWTGAEIKECCRKAHRLGITLMQAARYIVPVSRSAAEQIKALRQMAPGKFISASTPGVYRYQENQPASRRRVLRDLDGPLTVMPPSNSEA